MYKNLQRIAIITPALAGANNGNWQTAQRWAMMLGESYTVDVALETSRLPLALDCYQGLIALHARRSAASLAAFANACPHKPLWLALTGTDVYRDIATDAVAQASLAHATGLIVLQDDAIGQLPAAYHAKTRVIYQSAPKLDTQKLNRTRITADTLKVCVVGHLRAEKSPETVFEVADKLRELDTAVEITHIGAALDDTWAALARQCASNNPAHYRWLGGLSHDASVQAILDADVLLHPSAMEGGALAIIEAVQCTTPVIASRVSGHIGLMGSDYQGFFSWGDAGQCAALLLRYQSDVVFARQLAAQCALRSPLFDVAQEKRALSALM